MQQTLKSHTDVKFKNAFKFLAITIFTMTLMIGNAFAAQTWQKQEFKVKGTWSIEQRADGNYVVLSDDFKTKRAPDLKIFLSKKNYGDITGNNATQEASFVAELSSAKGGQAYKIPSSINVNDHSSIIIHCEQYSKLWASSGLK